MASTGAQAAADQQQALLQQSPGGQDQQPLSPRRSQRLSPQGPVSMAGAQEGGGMAAVAEAGVPQLQQADGAEQPPRTAEEADAERAAAAAAAEEERRREEAVLAEARRIRDVLNAQKARLG